MVPYRKAKQAIQYNSDGDGDGDGGGECGERATGVGGSKRRHKAPTRRDKAPLAKGVGSATPSKASQVDNTTTKSNELHTQIEPRR